MSTKVAGFVRILQLSEDNTRIVLLAIVLLLYMVLGAVIFQQLESSAELTLAREYQEGYLQFLAAMDNATADETSLQKLLHLHAAASSAGVVQGRRWDFAGSFHFVSTIVSTIGYGNATPQTTAGRVAVIAYGFLGCSSGILFFNLFLERIITLLAYILRSLYIRKLKKSGKEYEEEDDSLDDWKPSVYWVMLCLAVASVVVAGCASVLYCPLENWTVFEAIYFCFVSFATIGFGDYVSTQNTNYPYVHIYRVANFLLLGIGCCCIYSLFNVTSILVKQALNWVILRLDCHCCERKGKAGRMLRRHSLRLQQRRRSSITMPRSLRRARSRKTPMCDVVAETDSAGYDSEGNGTERRLSGELISMKDFLTSNKVSLAVMQKQLYETAMMQRGYSDERSAGRFVPGTVGPLAIVAQKLGGNSSAR